MAPVAVLSYAAWQGEYAADLGVIGATFHIQGQPITIVGIAPPGFFGDRIDANPPSIWIPLNVEPVIEGQTSILRTPETNWLYALGRLKPGIAPAALQSKLSNTLRQWLATSLPTPSMALTR